MYKSGKYFIDEYKARNSYYPNIDLYENDLPSNMRYTQYLDKSSSTIESFMAFFPDVWCPYYGGYALVTRNQWDDRDYISISDNDDFSATKSFNNRDECKRFFDKLKELCPLTISLINILEFDL